MARRSVDPRQRITAAIDELGRGTSDLANRYRLDSMLRGFILQSSEALAEYYEQRRDDALDVFADKLCSWATKPTEAYWGFAGELFVADCLRRGGIAHRFIRETREHKTPDIELVLGEQRAFLEVKTLKESRFDWFADQILERLRTRLPNLGISVEELRAVRGREEALVEIAVERIVQRSAPPYGQIHYEGEEERFTIVCSPGPAVWLWPETVDACRKREDGTPWAQDKLRDLLKECAAKAGAFAPIFLVWVIWQDRALCESVSMHIEQVLDRFGTDFDNVAGVVVLDSVHRFRVMENPSHAERERLRASGLLDSMRRLWTQ
jgi:hypothetical protein